MMPDIRRALLKRRHEELEAMSNEALLGKEALGELRENAIEAQVESLEEALNAIGEDELERIRQEVIAEKCEALLSTLEDTPDDELLGATLDEAREERILAHLAEYQARLRAAPGLE